MEKVAAVSRALGVTGRPTSVVSEGMVLQAPPVAPTCEEERIGG